MYTAHFGLRDNPFSITPDPAYLYLSSQHQEALAHLLYGTGENGGFVQLTGEVGTGKTTLVRTLLEQHMENVDIALCLNPRLTVAEFIATICDELHVDYPRASDTLKPLVDALNTYLLKSHAKGRRTVLIIDEAQNLSRDVLEQVRLLTNLETHRHKLLRIILVGQPELQRLLDRQDMRQLAQRITARYHLRPLNRRESTAYILHRLQVAGGRTDLFTHSALRSAHKLAKGIPRLLNVICDHALLGTYSQNRKRVSASTLRRAAHEALQGQRSAKITRAWFLWLALGTLSIGLSAVSLYLKPTLLTGLMNSLTAAPLRVTPLQPIENAPATTLTAPPKAAETGLFSSLQGQSEMIALFEGQAKDDSLERLLTIWGVESPLPAGVIPCQYLKSHSLRCLSGKGNWDELRRYNYPVILHLATPRGATRQVLLRSLDGETATLDLAGRPMQTSLSLLDLVWTGDYLLFWRPQIPLDFIAPGYRGEAVKWLRQRLALAQGNSAPPEPLADFFDSALREQVQSFQQSHNLQMDGLVGARTMIYLINLMPGPDTPFLTTPLTDKPR